MAKNPINKITLEVDGTDKIYDLLNYRVDFDQNYDYQSGKPVGQPMLSQVSLSFSRDSEKDDDFYVDWQLDHNKQASLQICFYSGKEIKRKLEIKNAYLVSYDQSCSAPGTIQESIIVSPEEMTIDGYPWKRKNFT